MAQPQPVKLTKGRDGLEFSDPYSGLATAVVIRAIQDWRYLIGTKPWLDRCSTIHGDIIGFDELRKFFNSHMLNPAPHKFSMSGKQMLKALEEELEAAKKEAGR